MRKNQRKRRTKERLEAELARLKKALAKQRAKKRAERESYDWIAQGRCNPEGTGSCVNPNHYHGPGGLW